MRVGSTRKCRRGQMPRTRERDQLLVAGGWNDCKRSRDFIGFPLFSEDTTRQVSLLRARTRALVDQCEADSKGHDFSLAANAP